jgi:hypothetical protein
MRAAPPAHPADARMSVPTAVAATAPAGVRLRRTAAAAAAALERRRAAGSEGRASLRVPGGAWRRGCAA